LSVRDRAVSALPAQRAPAAHPRLAERAAGPLRISFLDECVYVALPLPGDLLPAAFFASAVDEAALLGSVRELFSLVGLVEELDLNTRIWSKGARPEQIRPPT
jgi:hypothetical protein